jgi:hypothetical protein
LADESFGVRPIELADALYNAVELSKETGGRTGCPHVMIVYQGDEESKLGVVLVYGVSRIVGGRTTIRLETLAPAVHATVVIHRDKADEIQSALRGYGRGKATRVGVRISDWGFDVVDFDEEGEPEVRTVNLSIQKEREDPLAELADSDPDFEFDRHFAIVDEYLVGSGGLLAGPTAFTFESVRRITALKGLEAKVLDLAQTTRDHVVAVAAGPNFRGIIGELDRDVYAGADGRRRDHLL